MKVRLTVMIVLGGLLLGGCATKKYVAETTQPIQQKLDQVSDQANKQGTTIEETRKQLSQDETQLSATTEKANSADSRAGQALGKADAAAQRAEQVRSELSQKIANLDDYKPVADVAVPFKFNSDVLTAEAKQQLDQLVTEHGNAHKRFFIAVEGFTDRSGPEDYNLALSRRRADRVVNYLVAQHNIPVYRVQVIGLGKAKPADEGRNRAARAKNRRVEVTVFSADEGVTAMEQTKPAAQPRQPEQQKQPQQ